MSNTSSTIDDVEETQDPISSVELPQETPEPTRGPAGSDLADSPSKSTGGAGPDPTREPDDPDEPTSPTSRPTTTEPPPPQTTPDEPTTTKEPETTPDPETSKDPETTPEPSDPETTPPDPTTTKPPPETTKEPDTTEPPESTEVTTEIVTPTDGITSTLVTTITSGTNTSPTVGAPPPSDTNSNNNTPGSDSSDNDGGGGGGGLQGGAKTAVAVVVPIAAVALIVLAFLFWWRKRKQRLANEEQRKQELDDYSYTPHADPTIPAIGGQYIPKQGRMSGYRGWGTTMSGRNRTNTMSAGYSDATSPTAVEPVSAVDADIMAPMAASSAPSGAPSAAPAADVHRGPSNASSQYSATRSDVSDGLVAGPIGVAYGSGLGGAAPPPAQYYDAYHPYDPPPQVGGSPPQDMGAMPVIRDNPARRNPPRIESPVHYPQQPGISQNF